MQVRSQKTEENLFEGFSHSGEASQKGFGAIAPWAALAVILAVFVIAALYISHLYRTNERNDLAQSAELLAETVDARLSTTSEAVSRFSFNVFHQRNQLNSPRSLALARRLMESRPEVVELSIVKGDTVLVSYASGFAFEALSLPSGMKVGNDGTLETMKRAHESDTALFSEPYLDGDRSSPYISLVIPAAASNEAVIARISLASFMHQVTPSALLDRATISLKVNGKKLLSSSSVAKTADESFDLVLPPLPPSVTLTVAPFSRPFLFAKDISTLLILALGTALLASFIGLAGFQIRQRRTARHLLAESVVRSAMSESIAAGLLVTDMSGKVVYTNRAYRELFRLSGRQVSGERPPFSFWPEKDRERYLAVYEQAKKKGAGRPVEITVGRPDGTSFIASLELNPLEDRGGRQIGWLEMITDITEDKKIADELARGRERITKVLDSIDSAVSVLGRRGEEQVLLYTNPTYRQLWGGDPAPHVALLSGTGTKAAPGETATGTCLYEPSGRWFDVRERELVWTDGLPAGLQIATDITERRKNEELVAQQEKKAELSSRLITMGEMASSLAHELNQPLGAITNYASAALTLLQSGKLSQENCVEAFNKVSRQAERAAAIIKRIRSFAKRTAPEMVPTPVGRLVDETMELALIQAKKRRATVKLDIDQGLPEVICDAVMVEQLLLNLLKNAMEAAEPCENHEVTLTARRFGSQVAFEVSDHGPGIPEDVKAKLFEPFFSTKAEGMGIGLNICRSIAEMHQGRLRVEDNPGGGTVFILTLPALVTES
ncbi:MAG: ATP-binding protein [Sutterellaceae bacterium]|nr:ATP-binding protein [Sutterellaceae bacterium]MDY2867352.1 ATP-binding protein [Mesosutterella sp.]